VHFLFHFPFLRIVYFFLFFIVIFLPSCLYAYSGKIAGQYGGKFVDSFINRTGHSVSGNALSGYAYGVHDVALPAETAGNLQSHTGISFEKALQSEVHLNQMKLDYKISDYTLSVGRMINAAGQLHHDIYDFGAEGVGDNTPVSFSFAGNFPINVAQQIASPWENRVQFLWQPTDSLAIAQSYTPVHSLMNSLNYEYYAKATTYDESSTALVFETYFDDYFVGMTAGYTHESYQDTVDWHSGRLQARQASLYIREEVSGIKHRFYEMGYGCLEGDFHISECRAGWQISTVTQNLTRSHGYHQRTDVQNITYRDYSTGWQYQLNNQQAVGLENILRVKQHDSWQQGEFVWAMSVSHKF